MRNASLPLILLALLPACSFHSVATHWNGRVGPDGEPVYVRTVTNIGVNLGIILPLFGKTSIDTMIDESTSAIAELGSDHVRVIETSSENYWHGFPPFTWIVTPIITNVGDEYRPSADERKAVAAAEMRRRQRARDRQSGDRSHIVPDGQQK